MTGNIIKKGVIVKMVIEYENDEKMPVEEDALQKVTNIDREHFKEGGYCKDGYRVWEDGKEPPDNRKWVDEYYASVLPASNCFGNNGFKTPPSLKKFETLYRRTYKKSIKKKKIMIMRRLP